MAAWAGHWCNGHRRLQHRHSVCRSRADSCLRCHMTNRLSRGLRHYTATAVANNASSAVAIVVTPLLLVSTVDPACHSLTLGTVLALALFALLARGCAPWHADSAAPLDIMLCWPLMSTGSISENGLLLRDGRRLERQRRQQGRRQGAWRAADLCAQVFVI